MTRLLNSTQYRKPCAKCSGLAPRGLQGEEPRWSKRTGRKTMNRSRFQYEAVVRKARRRWRAADSRMVLVGLKSPTNSSPVGIFATRPFAERVKHREAGVKK